VSTLAEPTGSPAAWPDTYGDEAKERVGFFTDTSVCIGCKACEVACKEWNLVPEDGMVWTGESYDNTSELGANTWRHVASSSRTSRCTSLSQRTTMATRWTRCGG